MARQSTLPEFAPGQRWVSATEAELGLGIVVGNDNRRVEITFPASGERRTYAIDNSPLCRVAYDVGESIVTANGDRHTVSHLSELEGRIIYRALDATGSDIDVDEMDLDSFVQFNRPQERLFAGQIDTPAAFRLRVDALEHLHRLQASSVVGLLGPRVQLLSHQLHIAAEVGARHAPRVLLADEVGLGKTIEAGLILHQQLLSTRASRVLVLVPESLLYQWLVEMLRRFNLRFTIIDAERFDGERTNDEANPFDTAQLVLSPITLAGRDDIAQAMLAGTWDVVVIDEAHHLEFRQDDASPEYALVETLALATPGILMLTATPEQLGTEGHFARLRLLDPARFGDFEQFVAEQQHYRQIGSIVEGLRETRETDVDRLAESLRGQIGEILGADRAAQFEGATRETFCELREQTIRDLLDRHGTGRVLFRNTRRVIGGFPNRVLHEHLLEPPAFAATNLREALQPERVLGDSWIKQDPRVDWLDDWLQSRRGRKVLLICARASTAQALELHLRLRCGVRSAVFHENMDLVARDRAAEYFCDPVDGAQILLCSEIGSEGRNFQQAHELVMFDIPTSPDLLEQRIGRLDRIGQSDQVEIHVPVYKGSAQQALLRWFHEGMDAVERPFPAPTRLTSEFGARLQACLGAVDAHESIQGLIDETRERRVRLLAELESGRDRLIEFNSFDEEHAQDVITSLIDASRPDRLAEFLDRALDRIGVEIERQDADRVTIRPTEQMVFGQMPGLPEDGLSGTFDRRYALAHEDCQFLTWEHPLVRNVIDTIIDKGSGNAAFATIKLDVLPAGTMLLEAVFSMHCPAPPWMQIPRYLPDSTVRIVVDGDGRNLSHVLPRDGLERLVRPARAIHTVEIVRHARAQISNLITIAENTARPQCAALAAEARKSAHDLLGRELERISSLAAVNPAVRAEEIEVCRDERDQVDRVLVAAQPRLEALRVIVVVNS